MAMKIIRSTTGKMFRVSFAILATLAVILLYEWAGDRSLIAILSVHVFFISIVLLFQRQMFVFEKFATSVSKKELIVMITIWFFLLFVNKIISSNSPTVFLSTDDSLKRLWLNIPFILAFLIPVSWKLIFLWHYCKKYSLGWKDIGFKVTSISSVLFWMLIASSFLLIHVFLYRDWTATVIWNNYTAFTFYFDLIGKISGALVEEAIFRGLFFTILRFRMNAVSAWIGQAVLFGISHIFVSDPISAIGPGLLFGVGVLGSGSLYPGIFAHLLMNTLGAIQAVSMSAL